MNELALHGHQCHIQARASKLLTHSGTAFQGEGRFLSLRR